MTFNSFTFYLFFILVTIVNYLLPKHWRWIWLLIASLVFFGLSDIRFLLVLLFCTIASFLIGIQIDKSKNEKGRKAWVSAGLFIIIGILAVFKYVNFVIDTFNAIAAAIGIGWSFRGIELMVPIGISFFTFQIISYLLDVRSGKIKAERNFFRYALFISFFPQLLNGPIERYAHLNPQLNSPKPLDFQKLADSLVRIGWGLLKKFVIADRLAVAANSIFSNIGSFESPKLTAGMLAFSFQIYIDFSAYSDIAIGTASILGIDLVENFERPYFAKSVVDFWRRWHISLSNWLRDYVFLKLNYKHRRKKPRKVWTGLDILLTFLISGVWHGADWTFVLWGILHGVFQTLELLTQDIRDNLNKQFKINRDAVWHKAFRVLATFGLVTFAWIFFRAGSISEAMQIIQSIFSLDGAFTQQAWHFADGSLGLDVKDLWMMVITLVMYLTIETFQHKHDLMVLLNKQPAWLRFSIYYLLFFSITIFGFYGEATVVDFVYAQF